MTVRAVEGKKPYTGGTAIEITEDKVINLLLREANNLLQVNGNNELYCDLQLNDELRPTDDFPVGVTTGRIIEDNGWDRAGTILCAKTTSGDNIKLVYTDEGEIWVDNGTGTFKKLYLASEVDSLLALKQDKLTAGDGINISQDNEISNSLPGAIVSSTAPENPSQGDLWYDTTTDTLKSYDGTQWNAIGGGGGATYTAGAGINIDSNNEISNTGVLSVNGSSGTGGAVTINDVKIGSTSPQNPTAGMVWYDSSNNLLKTYDGTNWNPVDTNLVTSVNDQTGAVTVNDVKTGSTAPANPTQGMLWYDTTNNVLKAYDGTNWNPVDTNTTYTAGTGIDITSNQISVDSNTVAMQTDISVVSGDAGVTYIIKKSTTPPPAGTPSNVLTFVG